MPSSPTRRRFLLTAAAAPASLALAQTPAAPPGPRRVERLDEGWKSIPGNPADAHLPGFDDSAWATVRVPHNWEDYQGYLHKTHGNLHAAAWYRRFLTIPPADRARRVYLTFEGVGSYATVWVNGSLAGGHKGGRTTFTLDITPHLTSGPTLIAVRADHPPMIDDLPYVCGGCWGSPNTEGSQPLGIFRPVTLTVTDPVRIEPFGVHVWTSELSDERAVTRFATEILNHSAAATSVTLRSEILDATGKLLCATNSTADIAPGAVYTFDQTAAPIARPHLWSPEDPYLHRVRTSVLVSGQVVDTIETRFGYRWIEWPVGSLGSEPDFADRTIDPAKLDEAPTRANRYFSRETLRPTDSKIAIQPVQVTIPTCSADAATIRVKTPIRNDVDAPLRVKLSTFLRNFDGTKFLYSMEAAQEIAPHSTYTFDQTSPGVRFPELWSRERPYLHSVESTVTVDGPKPVTAAASTSFGIFETTGLANRDDAYVAKSALSAGPAQFRLNGKPYFINGIGEYEHLLGGDHAFTDEQISARIRQIKAAGFNAFRDAHHPHNLRYLELCDELGLLVWTQVGAHIYFNNREFRDNYQTAVEEWVRERRNSPTVILWGLQNESSLPAEFARELTELVRKLDPTTSSQRKTTTCNGGAGSDWNVPQNWFGTYGGNVNQYGDAVAGLKLVGEYGQYRTLGLHAEGDWSKNWSAGQGTSRVVPEELFNYCLETRIRQAEEKRNQFCGHFLWIFSSHANPGRSEDDCRDGSAPNDVGVVNYKGLLTSWGQPADAWYLYRANYAPPGREPMVYICSHSWPDRFASPGTRDNLVVFSNCDEVELFNDRASVSLGVKKRGPRGTHFEWSGVPVRFDTLYAEGRLAGRTVARDLIKLRNLPPAPEQARYESAQPDNTAPIAGAKYLYRVNCGGPDYKDIRGNLWSADQESILGAWGSTSFAARYASQSRVDDAIAATRDPELHRTFRYGRHKLRYRFPVPDGRYRVELYFIEPWYGIGGGLDCTVWRQFDVAINGRTVLSNLDVWKEAGPLTALKKTVVATASNGLLEITFPRVASYQAVISAIAISAQ